MNAPPPTPTDTLWDVVDATCAALTRTAIWDGATCHWATPSSAPMGGSVFDGTAGTALLLAEAGAVADDDRAREAAEGAIRHALRWADTLPRHALGFHAGRVGVAVVADRIATLQGDPMVRADGLALLGPLDDSLDATLGLADLSVVGGAAGAIPSLLHLAEAGPDGEAPRALATALGEVLLRRAHRSPDGWAWDTVPFPTVRRLVGLAHGTTGIARALFELDRAGAGARFGYAADRAWAYEEAHATEDGWPDYRYFGLGTRLADLRRLPPRDRRAAIEALVPPYAERHFPFWHHGAAGIALVRLHAASAARDAPQRQRHLREADRALDLIDRWVDAPAWAYVEPNDSLCDGTAGIVTALLAAAQAGVHPGALDTAWRLAEGWGNDTLASGADLSLMKGAAGTALAALRMLHPDRPSVSLPSGSAGVPTSPEAWTDARATDIQYGWTASIHDDPSQAWRRDLLRIPLSDVDWDRDRFCLSDGIQIERTPSPCLIVQRQGRRSEQPLAPPVAAALHACARSASLSRVTEAAFGVDAPEARRRARAILSHAHGAGALDVVTTN